MKRKRRSRCKKCGYLDYKNVHYIWCETLPENVQRGNIIKLLCNIEELLKERS